MAIDRERLTEIISADGGSNWWNPKLFSEKTEGLLPRELEIVSNPPDFEHNYNCFAFMLSLSENSEFLGGKNPVQQEFIKYLILKGVLMPTSKPETGDFVLYKNADDIITHGGILTSPDQEISKWMWGPTVKHAVTDVPSSFGDYISYFKPVTRERALSEYEAYKNSGAVIHPIEF